MLKSIGLPRWSVVVSCLIFVLFMPDNIQAQAFDPCTLFGTVYVTPYAEEAHFIVFEEETEGFADILVFPEENQLFADRKGLWFFTDDPGFADFIVYLNDDRSFADFSIYFTETESFAGCQ